MNAKFYNKVSHVIPVPEASHARFPILVKSKYPSRAFGLRRRAKIIVAREIKPLVPSVAVIQLLLKKS